MKTYVIGDIHGNHRALIQCFERSPFDKEKDKLIILGDVVDGWPDTYKVVEELLTVKNRVLLLGNHDEWFLWWVLNGYREPAWIQQGGAATLKSYNEDRKLAYAHYTRFYRNHTIYHFENNEKFVFVHGGFDWHKKIKGQDYKELIWDRHMYQTACYWTMREPNNKFGKYDRIFVGHTTTEYSYAGCESTNTPKFMSNLIAMDTGAGYSGKLTIMDVNTLKYWQSDNASDLYPDVKGR
jgi:serine/threonine protein phosphatase 1